MIDPGLENRVTIVTGGDNPRGIGGATARALAAQGALVLVTAFDAEPDAVIAHADVGESRTAAMKVDLADPGSIPAIFDRAEELFGPVEVLVSNAAHSRSDTLMPIGEGGRDWAGRSTHTVTAGSHDAHFAVNSRAVALMMAELARRHEARGATWGRIVNVSTGGAPGFAEEVSYGASKAALESYSRAAAQELARFGITVNIISPGPIQTGWIPPAIEDEIASSIPLGRVGRPEDVADVILFLASEQARWLTGQTLHVGGGHRMI